MINLNWNWNLQSRWSGVVNVYGKGEGLAIAAVCK